MDSTSAVIEQDLPFGYEDSVELPLFHSPAATEAQTLDLTGA